MSPGRRGGKAEGGGVGSVCENERPHLRGYPGRRLCSVFVVELLADWGCITWGFSSV